MRIAFAPAARLLSETQANGEALIASALIRELAHRGHEVLAYCERSELQAIDGVRVKEVPLRGSTVALARLSWARRIARDLERERVDVAHALFPLNTHEGYSLVGGVPLVVGPLNLPWPHDPRPARSLLARAAASLIHHREARAHAKTITTAARLLVTGESARIAISERVRSRCEEIPFGVDCSKFLPRPLPEEPTILLLSALVPHKGLESLIRALPSVVRAIPRARLLVAGSNPLGLRASMERLASSFGIASDVQFLGESHPQDVPALLARATVVCQPSFGEPFGMTVIEAMAAGRAVVGTNAGGIPDALVDGAGGRLVPQGDERALAEALIAILASPDTAASMGAFNRARAVEHYDFSAIVDRIERTYRQVTEMPEHAHVA